MFAFLRFRVLGLGFRVFAFLGLRVLGSRFRTSVPDYSLRTSGRGVGLLVVGFRV